VTVLESLGSVYVDFTLPQGQLAEVPVGTPVRIALGPEAAPPREGAAAPQTPMEGKVAAIDPTIDPNTRTIRLRAAIENEGERLRPGMFVNVSVVLPERSAVVTVPATSVVHAPYGDSVYVIEDRKDKSGNVVNGPDGKPGKIARQQFVRVGAARGDFVAIDDGLQGGELIVATGAFKLRNNSPVIINDSVKLSPSLDPRPANR
jgi:membrane fusion protein (multidrug efflux system)